MIEVFCEDTGERFQDYASYLKSEHWRRVRERYFQSRLPKVCDVCGCTNIQLHHRTYKRIGKERLNDLVPLCDQHHVAAHKNLAGGKITLWAAHRKVRRDFARRRSG